MRAELVEQAAQIVKDPPILINMVSKRVKQLNSGRSPLVERRPGACAAEAESAHGVELYVLAAPDPDRRGPAGPADRR